MINVYVEIIVAGQVARVGGCHFVVTAQPPYTVHDSHRVAANSGIGRVRASTLLQPCFPATFADGASVGSPTIGSNPDATSAKNRADKSRQDSNDKPLTI
jgi:hypothetical protein